MRLSFLPGELFLDESQGQYRVIHRGVVVVLTTSQKKALATYNEIRSQLESEHPISEISADERARLLNRHIGERLVDDNHFRPQQQKAKRKNTSRTFG